MNRGPREQARMVDKSTILRLIVEGKFDTPRSVFSEQHRRTNILMLESCLVNLKGITQDETQYYHVQGFMPIIEALLKRLNAGIDLDISYFYVPIQKFLENRNLNLAVLASMPTANDYIH